MSLSYLFQFKFNIYELLLKDPVIKNYSKGVYFNMQHQPQYPYLLIKQFKASNLKKHEIAQDVVEFDVCIFARENKYPELLKLGDQVIEILKPNKINNINFQVLSLRHQELVIEQSKDLVTNKLEFNFKAHIQANPNQNIGGLSI